MSAGLTFFVPGVPAPKGSTRAFVIKGTNRAVVTSANKNTKPWEQAVRAAAQEARADLALFNVGSHVGVQLEFILPRPKGHYGVRGLVPSAPLKHTKKPDLDKLVRTVLDGMTGILFADDSQVHAIVALKSYGENPGVQVTVNL